MNRRSAIALIAAALFAGAAETPALAQDSSAKVVAAHFRPEQAAAFSKQVERDLAAKGARLAMVFRAGRPRSSLPEGINYTHGAFWVYRTIHTADGKDIPGYAVYNLYAGDGVNYSKIVSKLVQDYPVEFTRGSTVDDMGVVIPTPEMQRKILAVIDSPTYAKVHIPAYSLVANPAKRKYQNCNTFMLNVLGAAVWNTDDPAQITQKLSTGFKPTIVKASSVMRYFGPIADKRLRTDDQPKGEPMGTATFESLAEFLASNNALQEKYVINYKP